MFRDIRFTSVDVDVWNMRWSTERVTVDLDGAAHGRECYMGDRLVPKGTLYNERQRQNVPFRKAHHPHEYLGNLSADRRSLSAEV